MRIQAARRAVLPVLLLAMLGLRPSLAGPVDPPAPPAQCGTGPQPAPTAAFSGHFGTELEGGYVLVPFDVPAGSTKVRTRICFDRPPTPLASAIKHTLDLGIYHASTDGAFDGNEFRGWGGSSRPDVTITPERATLGFLPGAIPAGTWAAEIGVAAVAGPDEGDPDGTVGWRLEVFIGSDPADADDPWTAAAYDTTPASTTAGWYAGDFHVHAEHSSPNDATMRETFDFAFDEAGLDFVTLSDYVTSRHWDEIGRLQADYPGKLIVRSAEVITYRGHVNNHGSATYVDYRTGRIHRLEPDGSLTPVRAAQPASRILADVRAAGGWTQVNHPTTFPAKVPGFGTLCRGCSWEYDDVETDWSLVDAMEVSTGPGGSPEPKGHELGPNPFTPLAIEWWDRIRRAGFDVTAVGSSDSHNAGRTPGGITQSPIGEATTVVYAPELSEAGIAAAVRAGRAYIKVFGPDGPDLRLTAGRLDGGPQAMMGDELVAPAGAAFTARVMGAGPGPSSEPRLLLVLRDGVPYLSAPVASDDFSLPFVAAAPGDYRIQVMRGTAIEALSNPITLRLS